MIAKHMSLVLALMIALPVSAGVLVPRAVFTERAPADDFSHSHWNLLVVKFDEGTGLRLRDGTIRFPDGTEPAAIREFLSRNRDVSFERLFKRAESEYEFEKQTGEARTGRELADLNLYYILRPNSPEDAARILRELRAMPIIETAYAEPIPEIPRGYTLPLEFDTPDYTSQQGYHGAAPVGINVPAAWALENGKGEDVRFIDVELCWNWTHEDLPTPFFTAGTPDQSYMDHGTAVMGEVAGRENEYGITGIAPAVEAGGVAIDIDDYPEPLGAWFDTASSALHPGDVWLIELHAPGPGGDYIAMEYWQANYDAIANSTAQGRICVEAGGNGSANLDDAIYDGRFDRNIRDSLAVLVGAGLPQTMQPEWFTNYGSRIDVNGWGSAIVTTGYGDLYEGTGINQWYTADFGGTSGASPIVVGACCVAQSVYRNLTAGEVISPETLRDLLVETGSPQPQPVTQKIGPRPNLQALFAHEFYEVSGVSIQNASYTCSSEVVIRVRNDSAVEPVIVQVSSSTESTPESLALSFVSPGLYQASIFLTPEPSGHGDGLVRVTDGDSLTAAYTPLSDSDSAQIDCIPPQISGVTLSNLTQNAITVTWTTDEPAGTRIEYGIGIPDQIAERTGMRTDHAITIPALEPCTAYVLQVLATDAAGNQSIDDQSGAFYPFVTLEEVVYFQEMMNTNPNWTISGGQWAWGQPTGGGGQYGSPDPTSGFTGSSVYGYNLNGDYAASIPEYSLTTSALDLSVAVNSRLRFQRWLGVEQPSYDHATIKLSTDGSVWQTIWSNPATIEDSEWTLVEYDISAIADGQATVFIRWTMGPCDGSWNYCGWNIDDVEIIAVEPCTPPTPGTPPATRTPTRTPTAQPTWTPAPPSPTPTPSASPQPTSTPTNVPNPSPTPTTSSESTPTPVPTCNALTVTLRMPSDYYRPGDLCYLAVDLCNPDQPISNTRLCVVLDVMGSFWFAPGWGKYPEAGIDYYAIDTLAQGITTMTILSEFQWPAVSDSLEGLMFYSALLDESMSQLLSDLGQFGFGFGP